MTRLRRGGVALVLAASTAFAGAAVTPAVAETTSASNTGSVADLPTGSSEAVGSIEDSLADNCGETTELSEVLRCAGAVGSGVGFAAVIFGALRTLAYNVAGI
jgi:hypothetical protein